MASGKNLTVYLTSDVSRFRNGLRTAEKDAKGFSGRVGKVGKAAGLALAGGLAAGAAGAVAFAVDGIKDAVSDQSSQTQLKTALKNTTKATDEQVASVEEWIKKQQELTGISDDELRPAMGRFLRSTKDIKRAQALASTAMAISVATGKDYGSVASALAKAQDGSTQSLKRLGLTIGPLASNYADMIKATRDLSKAEDFAKQVRKDYGKDSKEYASALDKVHKAQKRIADIKGSGGTKWVKELNEQFDGAIAADAGTYAGKIRRVGDAWGELQEAFGTGVLDNLGTGNEGLGTMATTLYDLQPQAEKVGKFVGDIATGLASSAKYIGPVVDGFNRLNDMGDGVLTNGTLQTFFEKTVPAMQFIAGKLTGNDSAANTAAFVAAGGTVDSRTPSGVPLTGPKNGWGVGDGATGSSDRPWTTYDPTRVIRRTQDADARARARAAKSRTRP
jgi:putative NIF3 family GTP cyclohydrolase 1 type 2